MINYAFRNKAEDKLLASPDNLFEKRNLVESHNRDERWTVDNIQTILFIKSIQCHSLSTEEKHLELNKKYENEIEIVSIHNLNCIEIITSEDIPQSLLEYFYNVEEIVRFSTVKSNFIYKEAKANKTLEKYLHKKKELKLPELQRAWAYLDNLGRVPKIIERKEELKEKIKKIIARLIRGY